MSPRHAILPTILLAVSLTALLAACSDGHLDGGPGPHLLGEATEAVAVAVVASDSIVPTGTRDGSRWYTVDLDEAEIVVPVRQAALSLSGVVEFGRSVEYWRPIERISSDYERLLLVLKPEPSASVLGLDESGLVIIEWDMLNSSGQTPDEEAAIFNSAADGTDPATAFAELAKARLDEIGLVAALPPDDSGVGLNILDALWPDRRD